MQADSAQNRLVNVQRAGLVAGVAGIALCAVGWVADPARLAGSYLFAFILFANLSLGSLAIVMLHHMTSGKWGHTVQRFAEAGMRTIPLLALLFLPIVAWMGSLYPWMHEGHLHETAVRKLPYLNQTMFLLRAGFYFVLWSTLALLLSRWSRKQDATGAPGITAAMRRLSAPGLILYALSVTFASVDWVMSLEPEWYSAIYGMMFMVGQVLGALCVSILALRAFSKEEPLAEVTSPGIAHDLGNLLLAFVVLWAYMAFSQFLITWSGNLPEEIPWYTHRLGPEWRLVALLLIIFHFAVPFLLLLLRRSKRALKNLWKIAAGILVLRVLDVYWLVMPAMHPDGFAFHWLDLAALLAVGGLWLAGAAWNLRGARLLPLHDPRFRLVPQPAEGGRHGG